MRIRAQTVDSRVVVGFVDVGGAWWAFRVPCSAIAWFLVAVHAIEEQTKHTIFFLFQLICVFLFNIINVSLRC